jgi:hypothetical protein
MTSTCSHCGNCNPKTIEDNGLPASHPEYSLLCVARVEPKDANCLPDPPLPEDLDENGLVKCGMQWSPNA